MSRPAACLSDAFRMCVDHARDRHRMSVERIADSMGLANPWALYKWIASGAMPSHLIRPFEIACRFNYVTQYLAASTGNHLLIRVPTGRKATPSDVAALQDACAQACAAIIAFYRSGGESQTQAAIAIGAINGAIASLACERGHIEKAAQPELPFHE